VEVTRVLLAALFWVASAAALLAQPTAPKPLVVFVCEHGSVKSVVAAALFNELASQRGVSIRAISRGTDPDAGIPQPVRDGMKAEGLKVDQRFTPTRFSASDFRDGLPAFSDGYPAASLAIRQRVEELLRALSDR
jgi:hypothetical protein